MISTPAPAADVRRAYVDQAAISYSFYVVGASAAFIAVALSLSETQAGLHSSAMALGMIVAGLAGERFDLVSSVRRVRQALTPMSWKPHALHLARSDGHRANGTLPSNRASRRRRPQRS